MTTIALITGANKGIGYETARQLGTRGATVLVGARDEEHGARAERSLREEGADARFVRLDVTDEASVRQAARWIDAEYGRPDVLVNNAGISGVGEPSLLAGDVSGGDVRPGLPSGTGLGTLRGVFETNVFGVVAVTNAMLPLLRRSPAARIVNVSSEVGSIAMMTDPDSPLWPMTALAYPSSKTALNMVTAMYAKELRETSIKVNAANPGYCATDLNGHTGFRSAAQGAEISVHLATLPEDGPTGTLYGYVWRADGTGSSATLPW